MLLTWVEQDPPFSVENWAVSREEDDLHQYVKEPAVGDQGAVSTLRNCRFG